MGATDGEKLFELVGRGVHLLKYGNIDGRGKLKTQNTTARKVDALPGSKGLHYRRAPGRTGLRPWETRDGG